MEFYHLRNKSGPVIFSQLDKDLYLLKNLPITASILFLEQILLAQPEEYPNIPLRHLLVHPKLVSGKVLNISKTRNIPLGSDVNFLTDLKVEILISAFMKEFSRYRGQNWRSELNKLVLSSEILDEGKHTREALNLSQKDFADLIYTSPTSIWAWEARKRLPLGSYKLIYPEVIKSLRKMLRSSN